MTTPDLPGDEPVEVRRATPDDASGVRRVVTEALLAMGFDPPDDERDHDIADLAFYDEPGRGAWVATGPDGRVVGCSAIDRGDGGLARLSRLAGQGLDDLTRAAVEFAREHGYRGIEAVIPEAMGDARDAVRHVGFEPEGAENGLLFRCALRRSEDG